MYTEDTSQSPTPRLTFLLRLLALLLPLLVSYDIYFQYSTATIDFAVELASGRVLRVAQHSYANWAGLWEGDVILTVEDVPFAEWHNREPGNYRIEVEREGQQLTLELPFVPLIKINRWPLISGVLTALVFWAVGVMLFWRRPYLLDVRLLFVLLQVAGVAALFLLAHPPNTRMPWMTRLSMACFHLTGALILHHLLTFPRRLGSLRSRRLVLGTVYAFTALVILNVYTSRSPGAALGVWSTTSMGVGALGVWLYTYVRLASPEERRRLRLLLFGWLGVGVPLTLFYILPALLNGAWVLPMWTAGPFLILAPLGYLVATIRYHLFDIDHLLNRALVYGLLSVSILALYLGPFLLLYRLLPGDVAAQLLVVSILTLLVGLGFDWARRHAQRRVDHFFYGGWYDYPSVVETISDMLARTLARETLVDVLTRQAPASMRITEAQLQFTAVAPPSTTPGLSLTFPLVFQDEVRALWIVGARRDGDDYSTTDRRILHTLARQAEVALGNVLLVEALQRRLAEIRQVQHQLLHSREEERARVARDLHDGPLQLLVGLSLQLGLLLAQMESLTRQEAGDVLRAELRGLRTEVRQLLNDLRQVCTDLRPPLLDTLGLGAALRALAETWSAQHNIPIETRLPPDAELQGVSIDIAVNLYRVAQEALTNVARHAAAQHVLLDLRQENGRLNLSLRDDGRGFVMLEHPQALTAEQHFGLLGMQERVALIGGEMHIRSSPGQGTTVQVYAPITALNACSSGTPVPEPPIENQYPTPMTMGDLSSTLERKSQYL